MTDINTGNIGGIGQVKTEQISEAPRTDLLLPKDFIGHFKVGDTTPSVRNVKIWQAQNTGAITIIDFEDGQIGQDIWILGDGFTIIDDNTKIHTAAGGPLTLDAGQIHIFLKYDDGIWYEFCCGGGGSGSGTGGTHWFDGAGAPASGTGADTDYYLDTTTGDVYKKLIGIWSIVGNIKGPAGPPGPAGSTPTGTGFYHVTGGVMDAASVPFGNGAGQIAEGNDARFSDSRTPLAHHVSHENGGTDEISVVGLSGLLADPQTPLAHTHIEADITGLVVDLAAKVDAAVFNNHHARHENGGADQISVAGLNGVLANPQPPIIGATGTTAVAGNDARLTDARTPTAHHLTHQSGGTDAINVGGLSGVLNDPQPPIIGATGTTAVAGNDARLTDARTPTAHHAAHEPGGTDAMAVDAAVATGSLRTLGIGAQQAAAGNDSRLSDARTPTAHASTHAAAGSDPLTLSESQITNLTTDLAAKEATANKNAANGYAGLDASSRVNAAQSRSPGLATSANVALAASTTVNITGLDLAVKNGDVWILDYFIPVTVSGGVVGLKPIFTGITSTLAGSFDASGTVASVTAYSYTHSTTPTTASAVAFVTASFTGFIWVRARIVVSGADGSIRFGLTTGASAAGNILAGASLMATKV